MRLPRRAPAVPVQEGLPLPAAPRTAGGDPHHGARRTSKPTPRAGGLRGTVAEVTGVPQRRDKRTRLVHVFGGGRRSCYNSRGKRRERKEEEKRGGRKVGRLFCWLVLKLMRKHRGKKNQMTVSFREEAGPL